MYNLVEFIDPTFTERVWGENNGYIYNYTPGDWAGIPGGGYHFEYLGPNLDLYASATVDTPFSPTNHSNAPDTVTLEGMIHTINMTLSDADYVAAMTPYLDLKGWLKQVAVETYLADFDCILGDIFGMNNFQLYRFQTKQLSIFIAWDKDNAFDYFGRPVLQNANQNVLMKRLMAIPEYRSSYFDSLAKATILAGGAGGWLETEARREYAQIQQAAYADPNKTYLNAGVLTPSTNDMFDARRQPCSRFPTNGRHSSSPTWRTRDTSRPPARHRWLTADSSASGLIRFRSLPGSRGDLRREPGDAGYDRDLCQWLSGAPVIYIRRQVDVQIPWEANGAGTIGAIVNGSPSNLLPATVNTYAPVILAITHSDGQSYVTASIRPRPTRRWWSMPRASDR